MKGELSLALLISSCFSICLLSYSFLLKKIYFTISRALLVGRGNRMIIIDIMLLNGIN
jgi:hypothetical protein